MAEVDAEDRNKDKDKDKCTERVVDTCSLMSKLIYSVFLGQIEIELNLSTNTRSSTRLSQR